MTARDPGLQPERTALAWERTALAMTVNAVLVTRTGVSSDDGLLLTAGIALVPLAGALAWVGAVRRQQLASGLPCAPDGGLIALAIGSVLLATACGGWAVLVGG